MRKLDTTMRVTEEFKDYIYNQKDRGESYYEAMIRLIETPPEDLEESPPKLE